MYILFHLVMLSSIKMFFCQFSPFSHNRFQRSAALSPFLHILVMCRATLLPFCSKYVQFPLRIFWLLFNIFASNFNVIFPFVFMSCSFLLYSFICFSMSFVYDVCYCPDNLLFSIMYFLSYFDGNFVFSLFLDVSSSSPVSF